jgi:predicted RNase H-related nuclease YkuK (DUF458 family)
MKRKDTWISGSGDVYTFDEICNEIEAHVMNSGSLFVGTDSFLSGETCVFATAICLHGASNQLGGKYFFKRTRKSRKNFPKLLIRMLKETQDSIDTAINLSERFPGAELEVHLDIGTGKKSKTRKFTTMLTSYAKSAGFKCKIKPYAWASAAVADRHSKKYV